LTEALSSFLTRLVKGSLVPRAKTIATALPPYCQTKQCFLPAWAPVRFVGWNGPGMFEPVCGPDLRASPAKVKLTIAVSAKAPTSKRLFIVEPSSVGVNRMHLRIPRADSRRTIRTRYVYQT